VGSQRTFLVGAVLVALGTALHWPDFLMASNMHYHMVGMSMSPLMLLGMALIIAGFILCGLGLLRPAVRDGQSLAVRVHHLDSRSLTDRDVWLLIVLTIALVIDVMKPATLSFVLPGVRAEYGLTTAQTALLPLSGLTGTAFGGVAWGLLADRIGRRGGLLLASVFFKGPTCVLQGG
jgi:putative MFS transporter